MLQLLLHLLVIHTSLRKVIDDMKSKNRTNKTVVIAAEGKETHSVLAQLKVLLNWSSKWVASNCYAPSYPEMRINHQ
jgi:hypothetical protein